MRCVRACVRACVRMRQRALHEGAGHSVSICAHTHVCGHMDECLTHARSRYNHMFNKSACYFHMRIPMQIHARRKARSSARTHTCCCASIYHSTNQHVSVYLSVHMSESSALELKPNPAKTRNLMQSNPWCIHSPKLSQKFTFPDFVPRRS